MDILSVAEIREVERIADAHGLSYAQMMQNAGRNAAAVILESIRERSGSGKVDTSATRVLVLVGPGNNGGDGLMCAAALADAGLTVQCYLLKPRNESDPVFASVRERGIFVADATNDLRFRVLHQLASHAAVIVDALLGTGASRPVEGDLLAILREVALYRHDDHSATSSHLLRVALDGPTGMNYDTGALDPATVPTDLTITFHAPKRGHYCFPAAEARGELVVVPIGIEGLGIRDWRLEANLQSLIPNLQLAGDALVRQLLPLRKLNSNKGAHGKALVVGGCADYIGAPTLSARAAYRVGAGLVAYAMPQAIKHIAAMLCAEATFVPLPESQDAHTPASIVHIERWLDGAKPVAVAIGMGMGQADSTTAFFSQLLQSVSDGRFELRGWLCDADALNLLAKMPDWPTRLPPLTVLTPHAAEMARLAGTTIADIQNDRIGCALRCAAEWGHVVVLKGAYTVIAAPDGRGAVLPFSNPAMATAGTGDVLAGCIAGLMAQGLTPFDAAVCGAYLHGKAGEQWRAQHGAAGMLAGDLLLLLPDAIQTIDTQQ